MQQKSKFHHPQVVKPEDIPSGEHYAIIEFSSFVYDDSYGETDRKILSEYKVFPNKHEWEEWITKLELEKTTSYVALIGKRVFVSTKVTVEIT